MQKLCNIHRDSTKIVIYKIKKTQWLGKEPYYYKYEAVSIVPARRPKWIAKLFRCPIEFEVEKEIKKWGSSRDMMDISLYPYYYSTNDLDEIQTDCIDIWNYCCDGPPIIEIVDK